MHVIATAGHVDHGKSTLVRVLTGMEPDRWAEERRRGMTIDLGFAWTRLPGGGTVAFVDVPGHERFVPNMLAGVGPVPAAMLVVAADGGWMPQTAEHVAALDALGVQHCVVAVTRSDLAAPDRLPQDPVRRPVLGAPAGVVQLHLRVEFDRRVSQPDQVRAWHLPPHRLDALPQHRVPRHGHARQSRKPMS